MIEPGKYYIKLQQYSVGIGIVLFKAEGLGLNNNDRFVNFVSGQFLELSKKGASERFAQKYHGAISKNEEGYKEIHRLLWENISSLSDDFFEDFKKIINESGIENLFT